MGEARLERTAQRIMQGLGHFAAIDNRTRMTMFTGRFATQYAIAITSTAQDTRSGRGNPLIMQTVSDTNVAITLTITEWNLDYVAAALGSRIEYALREFFEIEEEYQVGDNGMVSLGRTPTGAASVKLPTGARVHAVPNSEGVIDLSAHNVVGACVTVTYPFQTEAKSVAISATASPFVVNLMLEGQIYDARYGNVGKAVADIPSFSLGRTLNINMGTEASSTEITGVALAVDGRTCGDGMVYGYINELINDDIAPQLVAIAASPSPVTLAVGGTQELEIIGLRGGMFSNVGIENSECAFVSGDSAVATASAAGIVTAVGAGETIVTVTHNASQFTDKVDVVVTA